MSTDAIVWLAPVLLVVVTLGQWIFLRSRYLDGLAKQRARHAQQLQLAGQHIEQAKRQIAQLQRDLSATKSQLARHLTRETMAAGRRAPPAAVSQTPREEAAPTRPGQPFDGFADTLPSLQYPHDPKLLTTYPTNR
ncbi:MAG TPA: hypothetical protein VFL64_10020 [Rhizobacter sp.]|nr:hypothetical protein [Rhizobacter sp.]